MSIFETQTILTVTQLTRSIKTILENEYRFVRISGEISNFKTPFSGHSYFTLKDSGSQIRAVLFKQQKRYLNLSLQDGQQVICFGRVTVYEPRGDYQIIVDTVELSGSGELQLEYERLKRKLSSRGFFEEKYKKEIPPFPKKIIVISSPTGAAIHDFLKIVENRNSHIHIQIFPVRVQGELAAAEIAQAIDKAEMIVDVDIIVLCRGGGSLEDLWAFNEEKVAEAIFRSNIPVVTGIGHEVDYTIADFCADFRCPTPTGVAERIIPDNEQLKKYLTSLNSRLVSRTQQKISFLNHQLQHNIKLLGELKSILNSSNFRLHMGTTLFHQAMETYLVEKETTLNRMLRTVESKAPLTQITLQQSHLRLVTHKLKNSMQKILATKHALLAAHANLLNGVSPLATLGRGYSIVRKLEQPPDGHYRIITQTTDTCVGEELNILLLKGQIDCIVTKLEEKS